MPGRARELARRLAHDVEAVCRHYLSNGRREGSTWRVGDISNMRGSSLCVRLAGPSDRRRAAGRWIDFATGQHGDLLDLIALAHGLRSVRATLDEAERYLRLPKPDTPSSQAAAPLSAAERIAAARRLWQASGPIAGTLVETYLRTRRLAPPPDPSALRFHPACQYRLGGIRVERWPAMIAAVTDNAGEIKAVQRTFLRRDGSGKAPVTDPRRALGLLTGHAVRFGDVDDVLAVGEGIETMLAIRTALPHVPVAAALSRNHLVAFSPPAGVRRLLITADNDTAGIQAARALARRLKEFVTTGYLASRAEDFNDDLGARGRDQVAEAVNASLGILTSD